MIVMSTDFSNPASVLNLLVNLFGQHLNMQSRLLLGDDFESLTDQEVRRRLECYACVATEDTVGKLYSAFGFAELPEGCEQLRENVARRYIDTAIFDSPQVREFLAHRHRHDYRLYDAVKRMSWPAEARAPVRPALLGGRSFTFDNFDEQVYLDSNPDVANAVKLGHVQSGRHHFFATGHSEERMGRHWVLPRAAVDEVTS
ncbi:hypothetical protein DFR50_13818 [Roseiarcus fermentans]|uniref:Uncharacterized protein n=2 Tax=Roseiarcus fermentans TaxID=1473586 RepID=A0A366EQQ7_9HYPH|nr:hypothetical protein DFR50_13818 [Roseiarcus fermentans]